MNIWIYFHITIILLLLIYTQIKNKKAKKITIALICMTLIYFSAFRNGFGSDYDQYVTRINYLSDLSQLQLTSEPLFIIISYLIAKTSFSYILLFLISAVITNVGIVLFASKEEKYFSCMILLYVFIPVLYCQSFNLVRQFFALGLFYYSLRFIGNSLWRYLLCIVIAGCMHFSAFLLIPMYWILNIKFKRYWFLTIVFIFVSLFSYIINLVGQYDRYFELVSSSQVMYTSGFSILYNILFVLILFNNKLYKSINPIYINLLFLLVLFINASYVTYGFYRFAIYFVPIVIYIIPFVMGAYFDKRASYFIIFALILLTYFSNSFVDSNMLPVVTLFD